MIPHQLDHVYWLGGSPCSGKSSIVELLAEKFDLAVYKCDDHYDAHLERATPDRYPHINMIKQMSWDEIWMRPVSELVTGEIAFYREQFDLILADLLAFPGDRVILAEGASLLPDLVVNIIPRPEQAIFLVPTERFQKETYAKREWIQEVLLHCAQPELAFQNWMDRDVGFGRWVAETAVSLGLCLLTVDGQQSIKENAGIVASHFDL